MFFENRINAVNSAKAAGKNPYPHKFQTTLQVPAYVKKYSTLEPGAQVMETTEALGGAFSPTARLGTPRPDCLQPHSDCHLRLVTPQGFCRCGFAVSRYAQLVPANFAEACVQPGCGLGLCPGRILSKRASGAKLIFYDLRGDGQKVQLMCDAR